jgi:hypothetical protein
MKENRQRGQQTVMAKDEQSLGRKYFLPSIFCQTVLRPHQLLAQHGFSNPKIQIGEKWRAKDEGEQAARTANRDGKRWRAKDEQSLGSKYFLPSIFRPHVFDPNLFLLVTR